jgi:hypothetical protein
MEIETFFWVSCNVIGLSGKINKISTGRKKYRKKNDYSHEINIIAFFLTALIKVISI